MSLHNITTADQDAPSSVPLPAFPESDAVFIDHLSFPHIVDSIWEHVDCPRALVARRVCRDWSQRALRVLLRHIEARPARADGYVAIVVVDREHTGHRYPCFNIVTSRLAPRQALTVGDGIYLSLLDATRIVDMAPSLSRPQAYHGGLLLRWIHDEGGLEVVRQWLPKGRPIITYSPTQVIHTEGQGHLDVLLREAERVVINVTSRPSEPRPLPYLRGLGYRWINGCLPLCCRRGRRE